MNPVSQTAGPTTGSPKQKAIHGVRSSIRVENRSHRVRYAFLRAGVMLISLSAVIYAIWATHSKTINMELFETTEESIPAKVVR